MRQRFRAIFREIFPNEEKKELSEYLSGINQDQIKKFILKLVNSSNYNSEWNDWRKLLFDNWFHGPNLVLAEEVFKRAKAVQQKKVSDQRKGAYLLLTKTCTLYLLEEILKIKYNGQQKSDLEIEIDLFKAILIINERFDPVGEYPLIEGELSNILTFDVILSLTSGLGQYTINNNNFYYLYPLFKCQLWKSIYLFEFLAIKRPEILTEFLKKYKCDNIRFYLENLSKIIFYIFTRKKHELDSDSKFIYLNLTSDPNSIKSFVHELMISSSIIEDKDIDFRQLRARPLIEYQENVYTVVSETFVIQKLYDSVYFDLRNINDTITKTVSNFRSYFTYEFAEKTLFYGILEEIYSKKNYVKYTGNEIDSFMQGGPDYYVRNGNKIFLFESKDNLIAAEVKESRDFSFIKKTIDDRLVKDAGIPQLINNIKFALDKRYKFDENYKENNCVIYPIIVSHRTELDNPGLNLYLKYIFKVKLKELTEKGYDIYKVKELSLINIDALIVFSNLLKKGKINLDDTIDSYHKDTNKEIKNVKSEDDFDAKRSINISSYYHYMSTYYTIKNKINLKEELGIIGQKNINKINSI